MVARVVATEVDVVLPDGHSLSVAQIEMAINAASGVVDDISSSDSSIGDSRLKNIEIYLSAHFCSASDFSLSAKSEKDPHLNSSIEYGFKFDSGYMGTVFGQMANAMSGGILAELDKSPVNISSLGCH